LDETAEQTKRINDEAKKRAAGKGAVAPADAQALCATWHDAVRLLKPVEVIIPFAENIEVPTEPIRLRRDVPRLINIIRLVAWLHQEKRGRDDEGRILATEEDFEKAIEVAGVSFAQAWKSMTPTEEIVYDAITAHVSENLRKRGFQRVHVENALEKAKKSVPFSTLKSALLTLCSSGYLDSDTKRGRAGSTYTAAKDAGAAGKIKLKMVSAEAPSHSAIKPESGESGVGKPDKMAKGESSLSEPLAINEDEPGSETANGQEWLDEDSAIKNALPKPKSTDSKENGQMARGRLRKDENEGERVDYEYTETE
jgi:predicted GNAT family acetyltransferase